MSVKSFYKAHIDTIEKSLLSLDFDDVNLFWSVSNVLDKEYYDHLSRLKTGGIHEMGRNISVGLKYNF